MGNLGFTGQVWGLSCTSFGDLISVIGRIPVFDCLSPKLFCWLLLVVVLAL
jgi:hypothetical protein